MLIGALPDLTETQSGKGLIQIGIEKGKAEGKSEREIKGKRDNLMWILEFRFIEIPSEFQVALSAINSAERLDQLIRQALEVASLSDFRASLDSDDA